MKGSPRSLVRCLAFGLFLLLSGAAFAANVTVPAMELITHGATTGGLFTLQTYGNLSLEVLGGYKFGGSVTFGLSETENLENLADPPAAAHGLDFLAASISIREIFTLPLTFSYFIGQSDTFCSGDGFAQFGAAPIMTNYRGFLAFPTAPIYDGIYQVQGTGAKVEFAPIPESLSMDLYVYEDTHNPPFSSLGAFSGDLRVLVNSGVMKLEGFLGATTAASSPLGFYRGGVLFYATTKTVEFLAQVGIPRWDPNLDPLGVNLFYLLVEPRLHLGAFSVVPTLFWHPGYYQHAANASELGSFDVNLNLYLSDPAKSSFEGGFEGNFRFQSSSGVFRVKASPWMGFSTPGVLWTLKLNVNLWPFDLGSMLDGFVGVRAEF